MNSYKYKPLVCLLAVAFVDMACAQQSSTVDPVMVTATRTTTRGDALLSDVTIVSREEIETAQQTSLPEFLGTLPGVQFISNGGRGASGSLFMRGSNTEHSLILLDGQRMSSATLGTTAIEHIPLSQVDRIEIVRGPASGLYGADAIGGVIQVFTRRGEGAPAANFSAEYGRYNTSLISAGYGGRIGDTRFSVNLGIENSGAFSTYRNAGVNPAYDPYNPDSDSYRNQSVSAQISHRFDNRLEIGANVFRVDAKKHFDGSNCDALNCTSNYDNRLRQELESTSIYLRYRPLENWATQLKLGQGIDRQKSWRLDPGVPSEFVDRYVTRQNQISWQNDFNLDRLGRLMLAYESREESVSSTQPFTVQSRRSDAAVLGYQVWYGKHSWQVNVRRDDIDGFTPRNSSGFAYGYQIMPGLRARGALGTAYHVPTFNQLYWPVDTINFYQGNPNLKVERAYNREFGLVFEQGTVKASLTGFNNKVDNLLNYVPGIAPPFIGQYENIGKATLQGVTLAYEQALGHWQLRTGYDYLDARDDESGRRLQRRVPHTGNIGLTYVRDQWRAGVQVQAFSGHFNDSANQQWLGGYALTNVYADYRLNDGWTVFTRVNNLFDRHYVALRDASNGNDYSVPGVSLFVGVRYAPR